MSNDRSVLERQFERVELRPLTLEKFHRRRERKERNRRIGTAVVTLAVAAAAFAGLARALTSDRGAVPADQSPGRFEGTWISTDDVDGSSQTMTIRATDEGDYEIVGHDDAASVCSGAPSTMTGTGRLEGSSTLVVPSPVLTCDDESQPEALSGPPLQEQLQNLTFVHDLRTDALTDNFGSVWERVGGDDPSPEPTIEFLGPRPADQPSGRFVGTWTSTELDDPLRSQTLTIRPAEDGALDIVLRDESSWRCSDRSTRTYRVDTPSTLTGTGRLEDPITLVVPSPVLACVGVDGREKPSFSGFAEEGGRTSYTLVLDLATDRLFDNLGVAWHRGATPQNGADTMTDCEMEPQAGSGPGTCSMLGGEITFHADRPWTDHVEAYIDPRLFFLFGQPDLGLPEDAWIEILANPLPEASCTAPPGVPGSAEAVVRAIRSNPDLEATESVAERVGGINALRLDVAPLPGTSTCPDGIQVVSVAGREAWGDLDEGDLGRLYVLDLPGGSARALVIMITAPEADFEQAVQAAGPVVDSFEFHTG